MSNKIEPCPVCGEHPWQSHGKGMRLWLKCCKVRMVDDEWNSYARERRVGRAAIGPIGDLLAEIDSQDIRHRITDTNILWLARKVVAAIRAGKEGA